MLRNWTLRTRLTALVVALLAVTSIVIGAVMFLVMRNAIDGEFDSQVQNTVQRLQAVVDRVPHFGPSNSQASIDAGTVIAIFDQTGAPIGGDYYPTTSTHSALSAAEVKQLAVAPTNGSMTTASVGNFGEYRIASTTVFDGDQLVVGVPLASVNRRTLGLLSIIALVVLIAILLAAILGAFVVGRALRPLRRVAGVASTVAALPLDKGEVQLPERVPDRDTNPRTEIGQVGAALNNLLDSVGAALAARQGSEAKLRAFVADASHELRTPLASIRGYAELTRRFGGELTEDVQHNIDRIESESKRMTALVEDLLLLARLDSQRELDSEEVDLSRLLVDVVSDAHAAGRDHTWDLELPDEPVVVQGDDARLHQVFTNLLANARVHTPAGTRVTVELRQPSGDEVTVLVRDSGPGIPPELQPSLFERFVRGDSSRNRNTGSTGLGLSIVSAVVQAHQGSVTVTSQPGETTFRVVLPTHAAPLQPSPQAPVAVSA